MQENRSSRHGILTASQSILEDLLETQEFKDRQVYRRVETKTAFVWTQCRVELYTIPTIHLHLVLVILPYHTELYDTFGDSGDLEGGLVFRVFLEEGGVLEGGDKLCQGQSQ